MPTQPDVRKILNLLNRQSRQAEYTIEDRQIRSGELPVNPAMVKLARESRGITRSQLARKCRVPTSLITAIEAGSGPLAATGLVDAIAAATDYTIGFFVQTDEIVPCPFMCHVDPNGSENLNA